MRARAFWCVLLGMAMGTAAYAAFDAGISVRTRPDVTRVGAPFNIIVTTTGTPLGNISLPSVEGLRIESQPVGTTNTFIYEGGRIIVSVETRFVAVAERPGNYTIPPIHAEIGETRVTSEPVEVEVLPQEAPAADGAQRPQDEGIPIAEAFFIQTEVDKTEVYQGEAVLMALSLWRMDGVQASTRRGSAVRPPDTTGFYSVDLPPGGEYRHRVVKNEPYRYEVRQTRRLLFPTTTGELTIGGWNLEGEVRIPDRRSPFTPTGRRTTVPLEADPVTITVKPLPPRPEGFGGAVGQFEMTSRVSSESTYLGQPVQYTLSVTGIGNPDAVSAPRFPSISGVHASSARAHTDLDKGDQGIRVEKRFEYTLTPNQAGDFTIPPVPFVFFDPVDGEYATLEGNEHHIIVEQPEREVARTFVAADDTDPGQYDSLTEDIAPPVEAPADLSRESGFTSVALAAGYLIPVLGYAGIAASLMRRRRFERDNALARSHSARGRMEKRLRGIMQTPEPAIELYRALCGYVADRLNAPEAGMTPDDMKALCLKHEIPPEASEGLEKTLRACERVRYSGGELAHGELEALLEAAEIHIAQFDAALKEANHA